MPAQWHDDARKFFFPQWTRPDGTAAGAVWTTGDKRTLELAFDSDDVTFVDAFGLPLPLRRTAPNRFAVDVSDAPVYFAGGKLVAP